MADRIETYSEFWPYYLREHAKATTRALHYVGTAIALLLLAGTAVLGHWGLLIGAVVSGYAFAWVAHFFVEKNRPATFTYPFWSLYSDFRMFFLWLFGRLGPELRKAGIEAA